MRDQIAVTEKTIAEQVQRLASAGTFQTDPVWAELYQQKAKAELEMALLPFEEKQNAAMIVYFQKQVKTLEEMRPKFEAIVAVMKPLIQREEEILASLSIARAYAARGIGEAPRSTSASGPVLLCGMAGYGGQEPWSLSIHAAGLGHKKSGPLDRDTLPLGQR